MNQLGAYLLVLVTSACATDEAQRKPVTQESADKRAATEGQQARTSTAARTNSASGVAPVELRKSPQTTAERDQERGIEEAREPAHGGADTQSAPGASSPLAQGNHPYDLEVTRKIRKAVMADDQLSIAAKNVTIVANEGEVTLRGNVHDDREKRTIETYAKQVAGADHVRNELALEH